MIASLTSVFVNLPLVAHVGNRRLVWQLAWTVGLITCVGAAGVVLQTILGSHLL